jgi:hypothetical protein
VNVFQEVKAIQAGALKPTPTKPVFVPLFPFMYKNLDYGGLIHDANGFCDKL